MGSTLGARDGLSLGSTVDEGEEGAEDGNGVNVPPGGAAEALVEGAVDGEEHAVSTTSNASRIGTRLGERIGLVGVVADVRCLHGRERAVVEQARLAAQELELGAET